MEQIISFCVLLIIYQDSSEMNQDGERFIKSTFSVTSKLIYLPEYLNSVITNKVSNMKKFTTTITKVTERQVWFINGMVEVLQIKR